MEQQREQLLPISDETFELTIYDISFEDYVNLAIGNFHLVPIFEGISAEVVKTTRNSIMAEFAEAVGDDNYIDSIKQDFKFMRLNLKRMELELSHRVLQMEYNLGVFDTLKEHGIVPKKSKYPQNKKEYDDVLQKIQNKLELMNIDVQEIVAEKERKKKGAQDVTKQKLSKKPFIQLLASISQFVEFNVTMETNCAIVAEYARRMKDYKDATENKKLIKGK